MDILDIHEKYYERVKRFILSTVKDAWVADDLIQETFIKIKKNYGSLKDHSKLSSWIFRIAYNLCQDHFKKSHLTDELREHISGVRILEKIEQQQMGQCIQDKVNRLPEKFKIPLILFDVEGFTHIEIAEILDLTVENAKVRLHRARKELKKILKDECSFERDERDVFVCLPKDDTQNR